MSISISCRELREVADVEMLLRTIDDRWGAAGCGVTVRDAQSVGCGPLSDDDVHVDRNGIAS
jgi:hypothetical protein